MDVRSDWFSSFDLTSAQRVWSRAGRWRRETGGPGRGGDPASNGSGEHSAPGERGRSLRLIKVATRTPSGVHHGCPRLPHRQEDRRQQQDHRVHQAFVVNVNLHEDTNKMSRRHNPEKKQTKKTVQKQDGEGRRTVPKIRGPPGGSAGPRGSPAPTGCQRCCSLWSWTRPYRPCLTTREASGFKDHGVRTERD